jgi:hypothetical protein
MAMAHRGESSYAELPPRPRVGGGGQPPPATPRPAAPRGRTRQAPTLADEARDMRPPSRPAPVEAPLQGDLP